MRTLAMKRIMRRVHSDGVGAMSRLVEVYIISNTLSSSKWYIGRRSEVRLSGAQLWSVG